MVNNMENAEEVMQILERFTRLKQKEIPKELDDYLLYVSKTGDTVFQWSTLKYLFREKLLNVIRHFHDTSPRVDEIPQYPNVDPFNYENMKSALLERLELFNAAPFTIQRLCELLIDPRKQYSRIDKFMRALEKNILVVSTIEPGRKRTESENGDSLDSVVNGDISLDVNVDMDMENDNIFTIDQQNGNGHALHIDERTEQIVSDGYNGNDASAAKATGDEEVGTTTCSNLAETVDDGDVDRKVSAGTSNSESPKGRARDDQTQPPNPKKPKLDLPGENEGKQEDECDDGKSTEEMKKSIDLVADLKTGNTKENNGENSVLTKETNPKDENNEKMDMKNPTCEKDGEQVEETDKDGKDKVEIKDLDEKSTSLEKPTTVNVKDTSYTEKSGSVDIEEDEKKDDSREIQIQKEDSVVKTVEVVLTEEVEEKIIEKQEFEKCEKDVIAETDTENLEVIIATSSTATSTKDKIDSTIIESKIKSKSNVGILQHSEVVCNASSTAIDKPETCDVAEPTNSTEEEIKDVKDVATLKSKDEDRKDVKKDVVTSKSKDPNDDKEADSTTAQMTERKPVGTEKSEVCIPILLVDDSQTDKSKIVDLKKKESSQVEIAKSVMLEKNTENEVDVEITTNESTTNSVTSSTPIESATPTLPLNDQPMDEVCQDEVSPTADNEVVMAETISSTAMSTEAMDTPALEEHDGMEVDDTSQPIEEMDQ